MQVFFGFAIVLVGVLVLALPYLVRIPTTAEGFRDGDTKRPDGLGLVLAILRFLQRLPVRVTVGVIIIAVGLLIAGVI